MEIEVKKFVAEWQSGQTESGMMYRHQVSVEKSREMLEGKTIEDIFEQFYVLNFRLSYCNGHYYKFVESKYEPMYRVWIKDWLTIENYMKHGGDMW